MKSTSYIVQRVQGEGMYSKLPVSIRRLFVLLRKLGIRGTPWFVYGRNE